jgi:hypothetical protein
MRLFSRGKEREKEGEKMGGYLSYFLSHSVTSDHKDILFNHSKGAVALGWIFEKLMLNLDN